MVKAMYAGMYVCLYVQVVISEKYLPNQTSFEDQVAKQIYEEILKRCCYYNLLLSLVWKQGNLCGLCVCIYVYSLYLYKNQYEQWAEEVNIYG